MPVSLWTTNSGQTLDSLLSESLTSARIRQRHAFDEVAEGRRQIVIFGAGRLGRRVRQGLAGTDLEPVAFADNNPEIWGQVADGLPVLSPENAAEKYSKHATFVVAIWHPSRLRLMSALIDQMRALDCRTLPFPQLFWRQGTAFLPYFFWDLPENLLLKGRDISAAFELFDDDASRDAFVTQMQLRLKCDFECIGAPFKGEQYFPGLFSLSSDECFIDCGSYTGDTIRSFISQTGDHFGKVIAFEADEAVMPALESFVGHLGNRTSLHRAAVGARNGIVFFSGDGIGGGCVTGASKVTVQCVRLDDVLKNERISFVKMDIEGAELDALEGGQSVITRDRPVLAICSYHKPDHLWRIPAYLKTLTPNSAFFLRCHCADGLDTVCYAVPQERQIASSDFMARTQAQGSHS
jgi:FkbM family methyltransferase